MIARSPVSRRRGESGFGLLQHYRWLLWGGGILLGSYLLADISSLALFSHLEASIGRLGLPSRRSAEGVRAAAVRPNYRSIVERNIFDPTMGIAVPSPPPVALPPKPPPPVIVPPPPVVIPKPPLQVRLIGTVISAQMAPYAVIEQSRTREQRLYRVGDFVAEDARISKIERNRVFIARGEEEIILEAFTGRSTVSSVAPPSPSFLPVPARPAPSQGGSGVQQVASNQWIMSRNEIQNALAHLPELMTRARVVPHFTEEGKPDGFRIFSIREDSLYAKIGLQNGDILKRVNAIEVKDPQNFISVLDQLKYAGSVTIDLVRNDKDATFTYNIR